MSLVKILTKCGNGSFRNGTSLILRNAARQSTKTNNSVIPRRLLMSSSETGGVSPFKVRRRIESRHKVFASGAFAVSVLELYYMFTHEAEINNFLGTNWNTGFVGLTLEIIFGAPLLYIMFAATLPF